MNKISLEEFDILQMELLNKHNISIDDTKESYDRWVKYQEYAESVTEEEKTKYKYVIWDDFPTSKSWILNEKKKAEEAVRRHEAYKAYMALPWYEKILSEDGTCKIKDQIIEAFINNSDGERIRHNLCVFNIESDMLFTAIKHFVPYIADRKFTDEEITAFLDRNASEINGLGSGVCGDGGRVLRTLKWVCTWFYDEHC